MNKISVDKSIEKADKIINDIDAGKFKNLIMKAMGGEFYINEKIVDAADIYLNAAIKYKYMNLYKEAADTHVKSALAFERLKTNHNKIYAVEQYQLAGDVYQKIDTLIYESEKCYKIALTLCTSLMNNREKSKIYKKLGKLYEDMDEFDMSKTMYLSAYECDVFEKCSSLQKHKSLIKIAQLSIKNKNYENAFEIYDQLVKELLLEKTSYHTKCHVVKSILMCTLCYLIVNFKTKIGKKEIFNANDISDCIDDINKKIQYYINSCPLFNLSLEYRLLEKLIKSFDNKEDVDNKVYVDNLMSSYKISKTEDTQLIEELLLEIMNLYNINGKNNDSDIDHEFEEIDLS